ncbi:hypothetical protein DB42_AC00580 [Neochlamydia sp. EPS4]|nr:hypothetical protein DB42_AC00580 [Neochlamydia sp. EPS4]
MVKYLKQNVVLIFFRAKQGALIIFFGTYSIKKRLSMAHGLKKASETQALPALLEDMNV